MFIFNKLDINKYKKELLNYFIALIPLSLIIGNLITNLNIIIIILIGLYTYGKQIFIIDKKIYHYLIYLFFLYLIIITSINNWSLIQVNILYKENLLKSILYLRYMFLFLVINKLIENKDFNVKLFFLSCSFFSIIISIDLIIQFFFKKNLIGYPITNNKPSSFFYSENIAGGYLQKFSLFSVFFIIIKKFNKNNLNLKIFLLFLIFLIPIVISNNRMPILLYITSVGIFFLLEKKIKNLIFLVIVVITFAFSLNKFASNNNQYKIFLLDSLEIINSAPKLFYYNKIEELNLWRTGYLVHFNSGIQIWKENKFFGNGLKSFRLKCKFNKYQTCNTHPHNYFIEILVDIGAIGAFIIYSIFLIGLFNFKQVYFKEKNIINKFYLFPFFVIIFLEFFPFRSTGSFFTTNNSVLIFLMLPILLNIKKLNFIK